MSQVIRITAAVLGLSWLAAQPVAAKVSKAEADQLNSTLTPMGSERAGNKAGTIPAWEGGLTQSPPCYKGLGTRYCDPFPEDKPLYTINAQNVAQYKDKLGAGQLELLKRYPSTYKINVYKTRRVAAYPGFVNKATYNNALNGELISNGEGIDGVIVGFPFPVPKTGVEPVWNHKLRYRGTGASRYNESAAVTTEGKFTLVRLREDVSFPYARQGIKTADLNNVSIYFLQTVLEPPRLAGTITLVHETVDQVKEARRAWLYNPGQRRLRRAPNVAYDNPGAGSDGLRTNDMLDVFNGATDRYTWKIVGKREMIVPYNDYQMHDPKYKVKDLVRKGHTNQDPIRYELHRVWVVEANLRQGTSHIYAKRVFYHDEDTWQILLTDLYDKSGSLYRSQQSFPIHAYDELGTSAIWEVSFDFNNGRYILYGGNNESEEGQRKEFPVSYFDPSNVQKQATK